MLISEFNQQNKNLRIVEKPGYKRHTGQEVRIFAFEEFSTVKSNWVHCLRPGVRQFTCDKSITDPEVPEYLLDSIKRKNILVFNQKHGDRYFDASTTDNIAQAMLKIIKENYDDGYYDSLKPGYDVKEILDKQHYNMAYLLIDARSRDEYEGYSFEELE